MCRQRGLLRPPIGLPAAGVNPSGFHQSRNEYHLFILFSTIAYDPGRSLIYAASGGGDGILTIIRRDVTDTYNVIQMLPTRQRAHTLAVNTQTGQAYLVTDLMGVDLTHPGGIGALRMKPIEGSFEVLEIGN